MRGDVHSSVTKKQARAKQAAWTLAMTEGRIVNYGGIRMQEFKTVAEAEAAVVDADCDEVFIAAPGRTSK